MLAAAVVVAAVACGEPQAACPEQLGDLCGNYSRSLDLEVSVVDGVRIDADGDGVLEYALLSRNDRVLVLVEEDGRSRQIPLSRTPTRIAVAELDGDGVDDLVLATESVEILRLRGGGDGSFEELEPLEIGRGGRIRALAAGDLDGDGRSEVVVACGPAVVVVAEPEEDPLDVEVGGVLHDLRLADLDGDGDLDVAAVDVEGEALVTLHGDGAGGLTLAGSWPVPAAPQELALADLDGDGVVDAVGRSRITGGLWRAMGDGGGGFVAPVALERGIGESARGVVAAGQASSGLWSIIAPQEGRWGSEIREHVLRTLIGDDAGAQVARANWVIDGKDPLGVLTPELLGGYGFVAPLTLQRGLQPVNVASTEISGSTPLAVADVDGDGLADVLKRDLSCALRIIRGTADGFVQEPPGPLMTTCPGDLDVVDVNGDGLVDVLAYSRDAVEVALGRGGGEFDVRPPLAVDRSWAPVVVSGESPRIVIPTHDNTIRVLALDDAEELVEVEEFPYGGQRAYGADIDGDGDGDLVFYERYLYFAFDSRVYLREGDGFVPGPELSFVELPFDAHGGFLIADLAVGDLDGDERAEAVVIAERGFGVFSDLDSGAPTMIQSVVFADAERGLAVSNSSGSRPELADLDGDGLLDLLYFEETGPFSGLVTVLRGEAGGLAIEPQRFSIAAPDFAAVAPPGADGRSDLVVDASPFSGLQRFAIRDVVLPAVGPRVELPRYRAPPYAAEAFGDFDGDGEVDVAMVTEGMLTTAWGSDGLRRMDSWPLPEPEPRGAAARDLDGDGEDEVIVSARGRLLALRRGDDGGWTPAVEVYGAGYRDYGPVDSVDLDGDGRLDLVAVALPSLVDETFTINAAFGLPGEPLAFSELAPIFAAGLADRQRFFASEGDNVALRVGDLDGDGLPELLLDGAGEGDLHLLWNEGGRRFSAVGFAGDSAAIVGPGELAVVRGGALERRLIYERTIGAPARVGEVGARKLVGVGDCTGDGRPDLMLNQLIGGGLLMAAVSSTFVSVGRLRGDTVYCGDVDHDGVGDMIEVARGALFLVTSGDPT
ncbi:MAG: VCBS repeat-containing protein [Myxococcales bacterium]|nr:VCBS repeat-containing protein [Myxococcales bacterium]